MLNSVDTAFILKFNITKAIEILMIIEKNLRNIKGGIVQEFS